MDRAGFAGSSKPGEGGAIMSETTNRFSPEVCARAVHLRVNWFKNRRLLEPTRSIPPSGAEEQYYTMLEEPAIAA